MDPKKDQSDPDKPQYYDGYHCDNLGDADSSWMQTTAWVMLHEFLHAMVLFGDVPNYAATIPLNQDTLPIVAHVLIDFAPLVIGGIEPDPPDGYGGWNALQINKLKPLNKDRVKYKGIYNPDNYVAYASSRYFSNICGREFKAPADATGYNKDRPRPQYPF